MVLLITSLVAVQKAFVWNFRVRIKCKKYTHVSIISDVHLYSFLIFMALFFEDFACFIYRLSSFLTIKKLEYDRMIL